MVIRINDQNADFYLHHRPEQESLIKVPSQIDKRQIRAIRSTQFRAQYMSTLTQSAQSPQSSNSATSPQSTTSPSRRLRHHMSLTTPPLGFSAARNRSGSHQSPPRTRPRPRIVHTPRAKIEQSQTNNSLV